MQTTIRLILGLSLLVLPVWLPPVEAQFPRPKPQPTPVRSRPTPKPTPAPTVSVERAVWNAIKNSNDPAVFDTFLGTYPNGEFAAEARAKRDALRRPKPTPTPTPTPRPTPTPTPTVAAIPTFEFETVRLDKTGKEVDRRKLQARYFTEDLGKGVNLDMVEIPGGSFTMGSNDYADEKPPHPVNVSSFWMGKFEVTQKQWLAVMGKFTNEPGFRGDDLPVERVSWDDAKKFLEKLNALPNLKGKNYRLPTEAEWEYAARAGTTTPFAFGETITSQIVNYDGRYPYANGPKSEYREKTIPVGSLKVANAFGLFDMHGNVWEWCQDIYVDNYNNTPRDGLAYLSGSDSSPRVLRGGSWYLYGSYVRSAFRLRYAPGDVNYSFGFRVVCARTP